MQVLVEESGGGGQGGNTLWVQPCHQYGPWLPVSRARQLLIQQVSHGGSSPPHQHLPPLPPHHQWQQISPAGSKTLLCTGSPVDCLPLGRHHHQPGHQLLGLGQLPRPPWPVTSADSPYSHSYAVAVQKNTLSQGNRPKLLLSTDFLSSSRLSMQHYIC